MYQTNLFRPHERPLMRAISRGFAGVAPRSVVPNLIEIFSALLNRATASATGAGATTAEVGAGAGGDGAIQWMKEILMAVSGFFFFSLVCLECERD